MKKVAALIVSVLLISNVFAENFPYRSNVLWVTIPDHSNWLYKTSEEAKITVSVYEYGIQQDGLEIQYETGPELMLSRDKETITLKSGKAVINIGSMNEPGFRDCRLKTTLNGKTYRHHIKVGFEPEKIKPVTPLPDDFVSFWKLAKEAAEKIPLNVHREFVPEYSSTTVDCYLVKLQVYQKNEFVYGYLTIPKGEGTFPVVFAPPGAGIKPMNPLKHMFYAENGFIRFDMEIHGIRPNLDGDTYKEISRAFGKGNNSYLINGLDDRDSYYMKKVYLACVGALDFLTSLPEWDGKNLVAQGGSQGGALSLITAGLDDRITACAANHPALSDMLGYKFNRAGGYPHLFTKFTGMDTPEKLQTIPYYDVVNFARLIKVPVFMTWGFNDNTCPPTTSYAVYNTLNTNKKTLITPVNEHWVSTDTRYDILNWIKNNLK